MISRKKCNVDTYNIFSSCRKSILKKNTYMISFQISRENKQSVDMLRSFGFYFDTVFTIFFFHNWRGEIFIILFFFSWWLTRTSLTLWIQRFCDNEITKSWKLISFCLSVVLFFQNFLFVCFFVCLGDAHIVSKKYKKSSLYGRDDAIERYSALVAP